MVSHVFARPLMHIFNLDLFILSPSMKYVAQLYEQCEDMCDAKSILDKTRLKIYAQINSSEDLFLTRLFPQEVT